MRDSVLIGADPVGLVDMQPKMGEPAAALMAEQTAGLFVYDREPAVPVWHPNVHNGQATRWTCNKRRLIYRSVQPSVSPAAGATAS